MESPNSKLNSGVPKREAVLSRASQVVHGIIKGLRVNGVNETAVTGIADLASYVFGICLLPHVAYLRWNIISQWRKDWLVW